MKIFWRWRKRSKLSSAIQQAAKEQYAAGEISAVQYDKLLQGCKSRAILDRTLTQLEVNEDALGAIDWKAIKDWVIANWPTILRLMISIALLLDEED